MLAASAGDRPPVVAGELPVLVPVPVGEARVVEAAGGGRAQRTWARNSPPGVEEPGDGGEQPGWRGVGGELVKRAVRHDDQVERSCPARKVLDRAADGRERGAALGGQGLRGRQHLRARVDERDACAGAGIGGKEMTGPAGHLGDREARPEQSRQQGRLGDPGNLSGVVAGALRIPGAWPVMAGARRCARAGGPPGARGGRRRRSGPSRSPGPWCPGARFGRAAPGRAPRWQRRRWSR